MKRLLLVSLIAACGFFAAIAFAGNGNPPGRDPCSHGNSGKDCRTDPSTNGKDCDPHGKNGGVNEDHCKGTTTSTVPTTTTAPTTTTTPTTTTAPTTTTLPTTTGTTPTTTTNPGTTTSTTPTTTAVTTTTRETVPTTTTTPQPPTTTSDASSTTTTIIHVAPKPPHKTKKPTGGKPHVVKPKPHQGKTTIVKNKLPYTGLPLWIIALAALGMIGTGVTLVRRLN